MFVGLTHLIFIYILHCQVYNYVAREVAEHAPYHGLNLTFEQPLDEAVDVDLAVGHRDDCRTD